ncbi:MAG: isoprenylcysteine carboxylmethyltransferase family protein [Deltaproteobacteria bacterium]|nr:isoprenylcysteine carboxylmethyltransferase family protein [Deltaproteobacteria bacterium]
MNREERSSSLLGPTFGTIVFVALVPSTVIGVIPYALSGWHLAEAAALRWAGALLLLLALPVFVDFLVRFVREGRGTPAPGADPERLVIGGAFRYVRNPGYVGVLGLIVGQSLLFASAAVLAHAAIMALAFRLFVVLYEEPHLRRKFGTEYEEYQRRVPRWLPRLRSGGGG